MACNEKSIGFLLNRAARTYSHHIETSLQDLGHPISHEQFALLMELFKEENISQQVLAKRAFRGKTSVTRLLNGLEKKAYIVRCEACDDKRKRLVCLTDKGKGARGAFGEIAHQASEKSVIGLEAGQIESVRHSLEVIFQNTKGTCEKAAQEEE